jgi:ATP-dependent Clp protease ATP-binding subunit ClpX
MYDLPSIDGVEEIIINREVVEDSGNPLYIYSEFNEEAETSA